MKKNTKEFGLMDLNTKEQDQSGNLLPSTLDRLNNDTRKMRDGLMYVQDRVDYYDTVMTNNEGAASRDAALAMAQAAADSAEATVDAAVSDEVLAFVSSEVGRLNYETASVLGQTLRRIDLRQRHIEQRQDDMITSIR